MNWTIHLDGLDLYCESVGEGSVLILIPGFSSGIWSWTWQVPQLSKHFRVVTFDPRGISRSKWTGQKELTIELLADDVAAVMQSINVETANILGISFGGFVAQEFALKYPERIGRLVLASTSFGGVNHVSPSLTVLSSFASTEGLNSPERIRQNLRISFSHDFVVSDPGTVEEFCRLRERNIVPEDVYLAQLRAAMGFDAESRLAKITAETLVVTGDADTIVPMQNSVNLAAVMTNSRLKVLAGGSHMAFVEDADEFNKVIEKFLSN